MDKKLILNLILAVIFSIFIGIDSIIDFSLDYFLYNPFIIIPLFFSIFYLIIKIEILAFNKLLVKINIKNVLVASYIFLFLLVLFIFYVTKVNLEGLGKFKNYSEQGNFLFKLFRNVFFYSVFVFTIIGTLSSALYKSSFKIKSVIYSLIINITLFGLNYILSLWMIPIFNVIFLAIGFGLGG